MVGRTSTVARAALALIACGVLVFGVVAGAAAAPGTARTYEGPTYSTQIVRTPTGVSSQSKLWFHGDAWWALLLEPTGRTVRVFELLPDHSWRPTSAVVNADAGDAGDALADGDSVHVVNRDSEGQLRYVRLTFDPETRDYSAGTPVLITTRGPRAPASIVEDSTGTLWVAYATAAEVFITYSGDGGLTWAEPYALAATGTGSQAETAALVAYDDRIGLLWSDQGAGTFEFASHLDGYQPLAWARERASEGPRSGDRISLRRVDGDPNDTLLAVVTTSRGDVAEPLDTTSVEVLQRAPGGTWSRHPVSTIADDLAQPVLQVDRTTGTAHVFASAGGDIVTKVAPLDDLTFAPGLGSLFVLGDASRLVEPTVAKTPADFRSGLVVLAADASRSTYVHAEAPIVPPEPVPDPDDVTAPDMPGHLQVRAEDPETVVLSWAAATDGDAWTPARNGAPVGNYVVVRNGEEVATVTTTFFRDQPRRGAAADAPMPLRYEVLSVDVSGNRSEPATAAVELPAEGPDRSQWVIAGILLTLAAGAGLLALLRRRLDRRVTPAGTSGRRWDGTPADDARIPSHN